MLWTLEDQNKRDRKPKLGQKMYKNKKMAGDLDNTEDGLKEYEIILHAYMSTWET